MKKIISVVAVLAMITSIILAPVSYAASSDSQSQVLKTITKEYEFISYSKSFSYTPPPTLEENGTEYEFVRISDYHLLRSEKYDEKVVGYNDLQKKNVADEYEEDGEVYELKGAPKYEKEVRTVTRVYSGNEDIPGAIEVDEDGRAYTANLIDFETVDTDPVNVPAWKNFKITGKFYGEPGVSYEWNGREIDLGDGSSPAWKGSEAALLAYFNLPNGSQITSAKWVGGYYTENGETVRQARFTGKKPVTKLVQGRSTKTATYEYPVYSAVATYTNGFETGHEEYTVVATAEYKEVPPPEPELTPEADEGLPLWLKVTGGVMAGIAILAALAVLILYLIRRKKNDVAVESPRYRRK